ncbi:MAG: hypothetical protein ABI678_10125 [Kofleriaceae bacterium]
MGWPRTFRGFAEHVAVRANRLIDISEELFEAAPIRSLDLRNLASAVDELAAWPGLSRMRALSFNVGEDADLLTDDVIDRLLRSPHLTNVSAIWMHRQTRLTQAAYRRIVTATTLPRLSLFYIQPTTLTCWAEPIEVVPADNPIMTYFARMIETPPVSGDLRLTPTPVILRPEDWIVDLERAIGYQPCLHPEEHYGRYEVSIEAPIEHPIALDPAITSRRGELVPERGPKPSLMERQAKGLCAICGSAAFDREWGKGDPYGDPQGVYSGAMICFRCGTRWFPWDAAM